MAKQQHTLMNCHEWCSSHVGIDADSSGHRHRVCIWERGCREVTAVHHTRDDGSVPFRLSIICLSVMSMLEDEDWITLKRHGTRRLTELMAPLLFCVWINVQTKERSKLFIWTQLWWFMIRNVCSNGVIIKKKQLTCANWRGRDINMDLVCVCVHAYVCVWERIRALDEACNTICHVFMGGPFLCTLRSTVLWLPFADK